MFDFRRATIFCLGHHFSKHKMTAKHLGGMAPRSPPGYAYVSGDGGWQDRVLDVEKKDAETNPCATPSLKCRNLLLLLLPVRWVNLFRSS